MATRKSTDPLVDDHVDSGGVQLSALAPRLSSRDDWPSAECPEPSVITVHCTVAVHQRTAALRVTGGSPRTGGMTVEALTRQLAVVTA